MDGEGEEVIKSEEGRVGMGVKGRVLSGREGREGKEGNGSARRGGWKGEGEEG